MSPRRLRRAISATSIALAVVIAGGCSDSPSVHEPTAAPGEEPTGGVDGGGDGEGLSVPTTGVGSGAPGAPAAASPTTPAEKPRAGGAPPAPPVTSSSVPGATRAEGGEPFGNTNTPGFPLEVRISPSCIRRGTRVTVNVTTRPYAATAAAAAYSDGRSRGANTIGAADPTGSWIWTFVVSPEAPDGPGQIMVSAQDRSAQSNDEGASSSGEGAARKYPFEVKKTC